MDILIRIIIMIICGLAIPFIASWFEPIKNLKDYKLSEKIGILLFYIVFLNWFIITPSIVFFECYQYVFIK